MSDRLSTVHIACTRCAHKGLLDAEHLRRLLGSEPSLANITTIWDRLRCTSCGAKESATLRDARGEVLLDPSVVRRCGACQRPIVWLRVKAVPGTSRCPSCANDREQPKRAPGHPTPPRSLETCPRCGRPTQVRENSESGELFIGCTGYPGCQRTSPLPRAK